MKTKLPKNKRTVKGAEPVSLSVCSTTTTLTSGDPTTGIPTTTTHVFGIR